MIKSSFTGETALLQVLSIPARYSFDGFVALAVSVECGCGPFSVPVIWFFFLKNHPQNSTYVRRISYFFHIFRGLALLPFEPKAVYLSGWSVPTGQFFLVDPFPPGFVFFSLFRQMGRWVISNAWFPLPLHRVSTTTKLSRSSI